MRNKHMIRTLAVLLAVMLCMTAFSTVAFASDGEAATTSEAQTEPTDSADITGGRSLRTDLRAVWLYWHGEIRKNRNRHHQRRQAECSHGRRAG